LIRITKRKNIYRLEYLMTKWQGADISMDIIIGLGENTLKINQISA